MSFANWLKNRIKNIFVRDVAFYSPLERYDINMNRVNRKYEQSTKKVNEYGYVEHCALIEETRRYRFYKYLYFPDGSGGYLLRQDKKHPHRIVTFGKLQGISCIYEKHFITVYRDHPMPYVWMSAKHIKNGKPYKYYFPCEPYEMPAGKDGTPYGCWDEPTNIYVENNRIIIEIHRNRREMDKRGEPTGADVDYKIIGKWEDGTFSFMTCYPLWYIEEEHIDPKPILAAMPPPVFPNNGPLFC
ncbi:MAG: hypothetical protein IIW40_00165 [Clostridia bacterium]|nr:hypothetical protein [Clostridia bacterium]